MALRLGKFLGNDLGLREIEGREYILAQKLAGMRGARPLRSGLPAIGLIPQSKSAQ